MPRKHPDSKPPTMISNFARLRYLSPCAWDRVNKLFGHCTIDGNVARNIEAALKVVHTTRSRVKFEDIMAKLERHLVKRSKFNMKVSNIPSTGILCETGKEARIGYQNIRDTFGQFGIVNDVLLVQGTAYVQYARSKDSKKTTELIDKMKMGNNIIRAVTTF